MKTISFRNIFFIATCTISTQQTFFMKDSTENNEPERPPVTKLNDRWFQRILKRIESPRENDLPKDTKNLNLAHFTRLQEYQALTFDVQKQRFKIFDITKSNITTMDAENAFDLYRKQAEKEFTFQGSKTTRALEEHEKLVQKSFENFLKIFNKLPRETRQPLLKKIFNLPEFADPESLEFAQVFHILHIQEKNELLKNLSLPKDYSKDDIQKFAFISKNLLKNDEYLIEDTQTNTFSIQKTYDQQGSIKHIATALFNNYITLHEHENGKTMAQKQLKNFTILFNKLTTDNQIDMITTLKTPTEREILKPIITARLDALKTELATTPQKTTYKIADPNYSGGINEYNSPQVEVEDDNVHYEALQKDIQKFTTVLNDFETSK